MTRFKAKSVKSKLLILYGGILVIVVLTFNFAFYFFAQKYFYEHTVHSLRSIAMDVIVDDIKGKNLVDKLTFIEHKYEFSIPNVYIQVLKNSKIILKSSNMKDFDLPIYDFLEEEKITKENLPKISKYHFVIYSKKTELTGGYTVQIGTTHEDSRQNLEEIMYTFLVGDPIFIAVILMILYKMLQDILKPMNTMINTARDISVTDLDKKIVYVDNGDEFSKLAKTFNEILSRLQLSYNQIKRFSSDASHQLKTPLTAIRLQTDVVLKTDRNQTEYKSVLKSINSEIIHLQNMIDNLLLLTKMDDKLVQSNFKKLNLDVVLMNTVEEFIIIANKKGIELDIQDIQRTVINGEYTLLCVLCSNIIENAIKYTPKNKKVSISLVDKSIIVKDEGIGIEKENLKNIFDRFFRVKSSRMEEVKGYGLGLSMVKIIADLHQAQILIKSEIDKGTQIEIKFEQIS